MTSTTAAPDRATTRRRRLALGAVAAGLAAIVVAGVVLGAMMLGRVGAASHLDWPAGTTAAVAVGDDVQASPGADVVRPVGSLAKLVTALVVLDRLPLDEHSSGPSFEMTADDVAYAADEQAAGGGSVEVNEGDILSERQLLALAIVASSNNHARSLVSHVFGSEAAYLAAAHEWLATHGLDDVRIADASGMSPDTQASASDLLAIARLAAADPLIAQLAAMPSVDVGSGLPIESTNDLLGTLGVDGLKTGHTDASGWSIAFTTTIDGERVVGIVLGSSSQAQRATDVTRLIAQLRKG